MTKDNSKSVSNQGNNYEGIDTHFLLPYLEFDETVPLQEGYETLKGFIKARSEDPEYQEMLRQRDEVRERIWGHNKRIEKLRDPKKRDPLVDDMEDATQVQIRDTILEVRPDFEEYAALRNRIDQWRAPAAAAALVASQIRDRLDKDAGVFLEYDDDSIGDLVTIGEFEIGSPEWHAARNAGVGGSDVGRILKAGDPEYVNEEYRAFLTEKAGVAEVEEHDRYDFTTAIGRGCSWEEYIRQMFTDMHPELNVAFCKTSWAGAGLDAYRHANFDGLLLDGDGTPEGVLEIKTGTVDPRKWGPSGDLDVNDYYSPLREGPINTDMWHSDTPWDCPFIPAQYLLQVLWYAVNAGLKYGILFAVLDDHDVREYRIDVAKFSKFFHWVDQEVEKAWAKVEKYQEKIAEGKNPFPQPRKGFARKTSVSSVSKWLSPYLDIDVKDAGAIIRDFHQGLDPYRLALTSEKTGNDEDFGCDYHPYNDLFFKYTEMYRERPFIGIDLETNHLATKFGRIIETGVVSLDKRGKIEVLVDQLHGVPDLTLAGVSTGMVDVHRITPEMLKDKPPFEEPQFQKDLLDMLTSGVMVAHNAGFEKQWLAVNLKGFAEAMDKGGIRVLDTRMLTWKFMMDAPDNTLESFAEYNGIPYEGAHAATQDTIIMMRALWRFMTCVRENGRFITLRPTDEQRKKEAAQVTR